MALYVNVPSTGGTPYYTSGTGEDLTITGLNGDVDGAYLINGRIVCGHAGATFSFRPNTQTSDFKAGSGDYLTGLGTTTNINFPGRSGANPTGMGVAETMDFSGTFYVLTGAVRFLWVVGFNDAATDDVYHTEAIWTDTTTNLTSFNFHSSQSDGFASGSYIQLTSMGYRRS